jgi:hypothetical protein
MVEKWLPNKKVIIKNSSFNPGMKIYASHQIKFIEVLINFHLPTHYSTENRQTQLY